MFLIESIHHQAFKQNKYQVKYNDMSTYSTLVVLFCGIPHHNYHYIKIIIVKGTLLRLKIIRNTNLFRVLSDNTTGCIPLIFVFCLFLCI